MVKNSHELRKESHLRKRIKIVEPEKRIKNPYVTGMPLHSKEMFYGRGEILEKIASNFLPSGKKKIFALYGQRRIGKTSVLYQLRNRVLKPDLEKMSAGREASPALQPSSFGVVIDLSMYGLPSGDELLYTIADGIDLELYPKHLISSSLSFTQGKPLRQEFKKQPFVAFDAFLDSVSEAIGGRRLVLLFDEVEWLFWGLKAGQIMGSYIESFLKMIIGRSEGEWVREDKVFERLSFYDSKEEEQLRTAASSLVEAELLQKDGPFYKSQIGILTEWLAKYHPLEETIRKKI